LDKEYPIDGKCLGEYDYKQNNEGEANAGVKYEE
jgi:hypothetical protein